MHTSIRIHRTSLVWLISTCSNTDHAKHSYEIQTKMCYISESNSFILLSEYPLSTCSDTSIRNHKIRDPPLKPDHSVHKRYIWDANKKTGVNTDVSFDHLWLDHLRIIWMVISGVNRSYVSVWVTVPTSLFLLWLAVFFQILIVASC